MKRRVEKLVEGIWILSEFEDLRVDDVFRMYDPNGTSVRNSGGREVFKARSHPFINAENEWEIKSVSY